MHAWMANQNTRLDLLHISNSYNYNVNGEVSERFGKGVGGIGDGKGRRRVQEIFKEEGKQER